MKNVLILLFICLAGLAGADVVDISGEIVNPNSEIGGGNSARCTNDANFGWQTGTCGIDVDNNGFLFGIDSGNGNPLNYSGVISGSGGAWFKAGPLYAGTKDVPIVLSGSSPNTYSGASSITYGILQLNKDSGVTAIPGDITVGGDANDVNGNDRIVWLADNQIADTATITMQGTKNSYLMLDGYTETVDSLVVGANGTVDTGAGGELTAASLTVNGSSMPDGIYDSSHTWVTGSGQVIIGSSSEIPAAPATVSASDGIYSDTIEIIWGESSFATYYRLYRNTTASSGSASQLGGDLITNHYNDTTASAGQTYYYWVKAGNTNGISDFSTNNSGYMATLAAPTGVEATDGSYTDRVDITWSAVSGATHYRVFRNTSNAPESATQLNGDISATSYSDYSMVHEQVYYYWVKAFTASDESGYSYPDTGYAEAPGGPYYDISGEVVNPNNVIPGGYSARCIANAYFGWQTGNCSIDVYKNGFEFGIDSGGGNALNYSGRIYGTGEVWFKGAGQDSWLHETPIILSGSEPNTYTGLTWIKQGYVLAGKTAGVKSIPGDVQLGGDQRSILKFGAEGQIPATAAIETTGDYEAGLEPNGHSLQLDTFTMNSPSTIDFKDTDATVTFADSSSMTWDLSNELHIRNWKGSARNQVFFGTTSNGLGAAQVAQIGFPDPTGYAEGLYRATMLATGEVVPGTLVEATAPPFDISPAAKAAREAYYTLPGLDLLTGATTPLQLGMVIDFFGDSITWQDTYINNIRTAIAASGHTSGLGVTLINRGINGGTSLDIRDGIAGVQDPFTVVVSNDQPDVVVLFIGINDIWWAGTSAADFEQALRDIISQSVNAGIQDFVLATPWLHYEMPDGTNPDDPKIEDFTAICSNVAADTGVTFIDLRHMGIAYLQNNNYELRLDGSLVFREFGVLTYDGVHPTGTGNEYLAEWLSYGIATEMGIPEPACIALAGIISLLLLRR